MEHIQFQVEGMSCGHCVNAIETALSKEVGVQSVQVNLDKGTVMIDYNADQVSESTLSLTIENQGFDVVE